MRRANSQQYVEKMEQAMKQVIDCTNALGYDEECTEGIYNALMDAHRTLQQSFIRSLHGALRRYGESNYFDARNEKAVEWAKKVTEDDAWFPLI